MFVKICGITNEQDALLAIAMGAGRGRFCLRASSRQVAPSLVAQITPRLPPEVLTVGVFVDTLPERVIEIVNQAGLRAAQLHGHESPEDVTRVATQVPYVLKAFAATSPELNKAASYPSHAIMIDAPSPGSGQVFDWRLADGLPKTRRIILAGGLDPTNVADAIRAVHPWGVDVSSGVEQSPGHKDPAKVRAFIQAARTAEPERTSLLAQGPYDWQEER